MGIINNDIKNKCSRVSVHLPKGQVKGPVNSIVVVIVNSIVVVIVSRYTTTRYQFVTSSKSNAAPSLIRGNNLLPR